MLKFELNVHRIIEEVVTGNLDPAALQKPTSVVRGTDNN